MNETARTIEEFILQNDKPTAAVVIPLFGYWNDVPDNPVNGEVLASVIRRVTISATNHLYLIFVGHGPSIPQSANDPQSVGNIIAGVTKGGNVIAVAAERNDSYAKYVRLGMEAALTETNARHVVVWNPWVLIQEGGLDVILDRANRGDDARVISGTNVRHAIEWDHFDTYRNSNPRETRSIDLNFMAIVRNAAEMIDFDSHYNTKAYFEVDIFQTIRTRGFEAINSEQVPIFPFDFPWEEHESEEMYEQDRQYFISKWGFAPDITYGKTIG